MAACLRMARRETGPLVRACKTVSDILICGLWDSVKSDDSVRILLTRTIHGYRPYQVRYDDKLRLPR